jgi:hypothetical protein
MFSCITKQLTPWKQFRLISWPDSLDLTLECVSSCLQYHLMVTNIIASPTLPVTVPIGKILLCTTLDDVASCSLAVDGNDLLVCRKMVNLIDWISVLIACMLRWTVACTCLIRMHAYLVQQNTFRLQSSYMPYKYICKCYGGR